MGTRSLTRVICDGQNHLGMYLQLDGYLAGHGKDLFNFLDGMAVVNGISGKEPPKFASGAGCLAAQLVAHFKKEPGGCYLYPTDQEDCDQAYTYTINVSEPTFNTGGSLTITVGKFTGTLAEFGALINNPNAENDEE